MRLNLVVKPEQENYEPMEENIQLNGINTVCLRREWRFNAFTGPAHKYIYGVLIGGGGECKVVRVHIRGQQVACDGAEDGKQTHTVDCPCVMQDLGTGVLQTPQFSSDQ